MPAPVIIAGGGIAGLTMALTCLELDVPVQVFESSREIRPLGVGINLQPNAVRELIELGLGDRLPDIGVETKGMGAGRPQRQRHLGRATRPAAPATDGRSISVHLRRAADVAVPRRAARTSRSRPSSCTPATG